MTRKLTIEIELEDDAILDHVCDDEDCEKIYVEQSELSRIFKELASGVCSVPISEEPGGRIKDINGNKIGFFQIEI